MHRDHPSRPTVHPYRDAAPPPAAPRRRSLPPDEIALIILLLIGSGLALGVGAADESGGVIAGGVLFLVLTAAVARAAR